MTRFDLILLRLICLVVLIIPGPGYAQDAPLPTCRSVLSAQTYEDRFGPTDFDSANDDCAINWVQNGRLMRLRWSPADHTRFEFIDDGPRVLFAQRPPHLIDIDQDGWLDVAVFSLLGMVNGDYDILRYDPDSAGFDYFGTLNGAQFIREPDGYVVGVGRSSAASSGVDIFNQGSDGFKRAATLYVDAGQPTGPNGAAKCQVTVDGLQMTNPSPTQVTEIFPENPDLISAYCALYDGPTPTGTRLDAESSDPLIVPDGTVFYCQLSGTNKAVTVTRNATGYTYAFGPVDGPPELEMNHPFDQVDVLPDNGAGSSRFGEITFLNGAYRYTVTYGYQLYDDAGQLRDIDETFSRTLVVTEGDDVANPVFKRTCDPIRAADLIAFLDRS
ncbi:hypothetical protein [Yoonia sp. BS5-3]|uniref:VCBS repeat-containing protein n=1 Tax=Yoonia phaeophyticola TaxID=3137369 RepID=A0ABZ2V6D7_9RHOB